MSVSTLFADRNNIWLVIGLIGQGLFFMRFFVQWIASERQRQSVIPTAFWYFSLSGGLVLLAYAIWRRDPIFIIGQASGLVIYCRNLYFVTHAAPGADASRDASALRSAG